MSGGCKTSTYDTLLWFGKVLKWLQSREKGPHDSFLKRDIPEDLFRNDYFIKAKWMTLIKKGELETVQGCTPVLRWNVNKTHLEFRGKGINL
ncbi:MAG: hypothetical protein GQ576_00145 [Methanococcoides sp.]|nr:hypothetical protein [Methanococcoides sp.]